MIERQRRPVVPSTRLDRAIESLFPKWGLRRQEARLRIEMATQFRGSGYLRTISDWISSTVGTGVNLLSHDLDSLRARSQDLNANDPVAAGATETLTLNTVGQGLQPQSRLRAEILGIGEDEAEKLRRQAENVFDLWSPNADAANRLDFSEIQFLAFRKIIEDGEILAVPGWLDENWRPLKRIIEMVRAERLGTPWGMMGPFQGIELGPMRKEPLKYWIRKNDISKNDYEIPRYEWVGIPARDAYGRPMVIHAFPSKEPGQLRGIPFFAPALTYFKHLSDIFDAKLVAEKISACLAIFITRNDPNNMQLPLPTQGTGPDQGRPILEPGMILPLQNGESVSAVDPGRGNDSFAIFVEGVLRIIGVSLGMPYELLLKDFSKTNYSSARASLLEGRRHFSNWRAWFGRKFCQPVWELILEEAMLRGLFSVRRQDFYANRAEYCRAAWIGGGWGWVDPIKEVESSKLAIDWGLSTYAEEAASQGRDWEEVLLQKAREVAKIKELGLVIPEARAKQVAQTETAPEPGAPGGGQ